MNLDISFCSKENCKNKECERNQEQLREIDYLMHPISIANFTECKYFKKGV